VTPAAKAGSIFDDDYVPPKRSEPAKPSPAPVAPSVTPSSSPNAPAPPAVRPPDGTPPVRAVHRQVPDHATRTKLRKLFEEVYAKELKDRTPAGRRKLAESLLDEARKNPEGSPDRFVLLTGAIQSAEEGQSLRICFAAAKILSSEYGTDELATEADAISKAGGDSTPAAFATVSNIEAALDLADQLVEEDDFATAAQVEAVLQRVIGSIPDADLKSDVRNQIREVAAMREATEKVAPAITKLKQSPEDPAANLAVGSYYCFQLGKWGIGLPLLAKSSDPELMKLAGNELAGSAGADAIADGWYEAAPKLAPADSPKALQHAAALYRTALADLTGLRKLAVEKRIDQIPQGRQRRIDLLALFDPATDVIKGNWRMEDGSLLSDSSDEPRVRFPYHPPAEYDFRIEFTRIKGNDNVSQVFTKGGHAVRWAMAAYRNRVCGFEVIDGVNCYDSKTSAKKDKWFAVGKKHSAVLKIRAQSVQAIIDGKLISEWETDDGRGATNPIPIGDDLALGLGTCRSVFAFSEIEVVEVSGPGEMAPPK
jgi:hypothetical protein